jgi:hypothetical protein
MSFAHLAFVESMYDVFVLLHTCQRWCDAGNARAGHQLQHLQKITHSAVARQAAIVC